MFMKERTEPLAQLLENSNSSFLALSYSLLSPLLFIPSLSFSLQGYYNY